MYIKKKSTAAADLNRRQLAGCFNGIYVLKYFQSSEVRVFPPCCSPGLGCLGEGVGGARAGGVS